MTITVIPRGTVTSRGGQQPPPSSAGKLAGTLLSVAVAGMAEPGRFRRGRTYVTQGAVGRIDIDAGTLAARVQGSDPQPYLVRVATGVVDRPDTDTPASLAKSDVMALVPEGDEITVSCTCPDAETPCKHAVAAILVFADEIGARPELLVAWRCGSDDDRPRATVGGRAARRADRHLRLAPAPPPPTPFTTPEWEAFEGRRLPPVPALPVELRHQPASLGSEIVDRLDVSAIVRSAIDTIRHAAT